MNRLGIYFFFDKDGIVDDYVLYFLRNFKKVCSEVCVVVNGNLEPHSKEELEKLSNKLIIRENKGFDSWAYKDAIEDYGYSNIKKYGELVLCNFTFFGPIYPIDEMFSEMDSRDCDFWGIHRSRKEPHVYMAGVEICEHIQSHFMCFKKKIIQSKDFVNYWKSLQPINNYEEAVAYHELKITKYFENLGYKSSTFIDYTKYFNKVGNSSVFCAIQQIKEDRCPILKRKALFIKRGKIEFQQLDGENPFNILNFLRNNTEYPYECIKENIYRCFASENRNFFNILKKMYFYTLLLFVFKRKKRTKIKKKINNLVIFNNSSILTFINKKCKSFIHLFYKVKYKNNIKVKRFLFFSYKCSSKHLIYKNGNSCIIYKDNGQKIINPPKIKGLNVNFSGKNNILKIYEPCNFINNNTINLFGDNCECVLKKCQLSMVDLNLQHSAYCHIDEGSTVCGYIHLANEKNLSLSIGKDCMFSGEAAIWCTDGHIIKDKITNKIINRTKQGVVIGDHCWIGHRVTILKNTTLSNDTIVGAYSLVSGTFNEKNIIIAGNPAKKIKENILWSRNPLD
ncbi:MAG: hypothetical protein IKC10_03450 [Alphaproteobacteria bacterium]|nr:hypothetical protein [Alphaproteobacteria bacterium]